MADKGVTDKDIVEVLKAAGVTPGGVPVASGSDAALVDALNAAGVDPAVVGVTREPRGYTEDEPADRAAMRTRGATKRTRPAAGKFPDDPEPEPPEEVKALAKRLGLVGQFTHGIPIAGPLIERGSAAIAAGLPPYQKDTTFGERFEGYSDQIKQANKWYDKENPISSGIAGFGGAVAGTVPLSMTRLGGLAMGTRGPSVGSRMWTGGIGGSGIGAFDAALRGENVGHGAMIGAIGGAGGPLVGEAFRGGTNLVSSYLWPRPGPLKDMTSGAVNKLTGAIEGETPASIQAAKDRMGPAGMLADVNTGMGDIAGGLAATSGGPHKQIVREAFRVRDAAASGRIDKAITDAAGPAIDDVAWAKLTTEARKQAADPLYDAFRAATIDPSSGKLQDLIPRLKGAGAFKLAEEHAAITGEPVNIKSLINGTKTNFPTAQSWDYVKRGLDQAIDIAYGAGNKTKARDLIKLKNELVGELDAASPVYRDARRAFADHSALLDQMQAGKDTFLGGRSGLSVNELREELKGLSMPELTARLIGLRAAAEETMGATFRGDTTLRNMLLAPNNQKKMELLLGKDKAKKLTEAMEQEKFLKDQSQTLIHGTQTTPKAEQVKSLQAPSSEPWGLNLTTPTTWVPPFVRRELLPSTIFDAWRGQKQGETFNQLARAVTTPAGPTMNDLIAAIQTEAARQAAVSQGGQAVGNLVAGAISGPGSVWARRKLSRENEPKKKQ